MQLIWLSLAILLLMGCFFAYYYTKKKERYKLWIAGLSILMLDIVLETYGTLSGNWTYNESIFFLGTLPIELLIIFFSAGFIGTALIIILAKQHNGKIDWRVSNIFLVLGAIGLFFVILQKVPIFLPLIFFGFFGIFVSKKPTFVVSIGLIALVVDLIFEIIFTTTGTYQYLTGLDWTTPFSYFFGACAIAGVLTREKKYKSKIDLF